METIPISRFKAQCLAILARVKKTRRPILVTRFGVPVAEVVPPSEASLSPRWLGSLGGTVRFTSDIVSPASDERDWEALRG
jgi:prevent-host-death family protein